MDFLIGWFSSTLASSSTYPLDLLKTQFQRTRITQPNQTVLSLAKNNLSKSGPLGFYKGLPPHLLTYPQFWAIYFQLEKLKPSQYLTSNRGESTFQSFFLKFTDVMICSSGASLATNPLFVIKIRRQTEILKQANKPHQPRYPYPNPSYPQLISNIIRYEGVRGLFKGYLATVLNNIKLGIQMPLYAYLKNQTDSPTLSSFTSKLVASSALYPLDIIRTNIRDHSKEKLSLTEVTRKIYTNHGLKGFFRGLILYQAVTCPNFMIMMISKEYLTTKL